MADTKKYVKQLRIGNDIANIKDEECRDDLNNYKDTMSRFLTLGGEKSDIDTIKTGLLNIVYPVGCIYWSSVNKNPRDLFGIGTWVQIKDRFIWAKGDEDEINALEGSKTATLSIDNLPAHDHQGRTGYTNTDHWHATWDMSGDTVASIWCEREGLFNGRGTMFNSSYRMYFEDFIAKYCGGDNEDSKRPRKLTINFSHTHNTKSVTETYSNNNQNHSHTIPPCGSDEPFSIMPPYIVKYCWERTA